MTDQSHQIVQKLWNYCNVLRDDLSACPPAGARAGIGRRDELPADAQASGDYPSAQLGTSSEQLTYLLFLKMADERIH
jgi:hypothetical protein